MMPEERTGDSMKADICSPSKLKVQAVLLRTPCDDPVKRLLFSSGEKANKEKRT